MTVQLTIDEARKLVLHSQRLPPGKRDGAALDATLSAIEHLGYVQIDTISAVQRAHHHTLWNRNPRYQLAHLDQFVEDKRVYEHWSHAAAYLPMRDFRHSLPLKQRIASGEQRHWYVCDDRLLDSVLKRIAIEGPLMAKDFEDTGDKAARKPGEWSSKPAKRALETLFMRGDLMVCRRQSFHKVYDLTERVLPSDVDTTVPTPIEHARFLIRRYLETNGVGRTEEIVYLLKNVKAQVSDCLQEMIAGGEVRQVSVEDEYYFALPESLSLINKPLARRKLKILSPFDNLLIQRKRMRALFEFDYLIECYVPQAKRQYGYFSLPILWDGKLVARMDCKAARKESLLHIVHLAMERSFTKHDAFLSALQKELVAFAKFNECSRLQVHRTSPAKYKPLLTKLIRNAT